MIAVYLVFDQLGQLELTNDAQIEESAHRFRLRFCFHWFEIMLWGSS